MAQPGLRSNHADIFQPRVLYTTYKHVVNTTLREIIWHGRTAVPDKPTVWNIKLVQLRIGNSYGTYGRAEDHTMNTIGVFTSRDCSIG
jgi:hypothetical protein